jgi:hypothetical protein
MSQDRIIHTDHHGASSNRPFGPLVFRPWLPDAIRSLEDEELRILVLALLQEWRARAEMANG